MSTAELGDVRGSEKGYLFRKEAPQFPRAPGRAGVEESRSWKRAGRRMGIWQSQTRLIEKRQHAARVTSEMSWACQPCRTTTGRGRSRVLACRGVENYCLAAASHSPFESCGVCHFTVARPWLIVRRDNPHVARRHFQPIGNVVQSRTRSWVSSHRCSACDWGTHQSEYPTQLALHSNIRSLTAWRELEDLPHGPGSDESDMLKHNLVDLDFPMDVYGNSCIRIQLSLYPAIADGIGAKDAANTNKLYPQTRTWSKLTSITMRAIQRRQSPSRYLLGKALNSD